MHKFAICTQTGFGHYHYKNWSSDFVCPDCQRKGRFSLNFLGQRKVLCNGKRFYKLGKDFSLAEARNLGIAADADDICIAFIKAGAA